MNATSDNLAHQRSAKRGAVASALRVSWQTILRRLYNARYLLVQERCRLCQRFLHPEIPYFEHEIFAPAGEYLLHKTTIESEAICRQCCKVLSHSKPLWANLYTNVGENIVHNLPVFSGGLFESATKTLIHDFKYKGDVLLAKDLSVLLWHAWELLLRTTDRMEWSERDFADPAKSSKPILVPVPLHWLRERRRGFNQSEVIARKLAKMVGLSVERGALKRKRNTASQQELSKEERQSNLCNAFKADASIVRGKAIILIDDVCTSGATLVECANVLRDAGAPRIFGLTLARVPLTKGSTGLS
jgi:ComF family protein